MKYTIKQFKEKIEAGNAKNYLVGAKEVHGIARSYVEWCNYMHSLFNDGFKVLIDVLPVDGQAETLKEMKLRYYKGLGNKFQSGKGKRLLDEVDQAVLLPVIKSIAASFTQQN